MKVHLVFSLNKTGSFENGTIHVVSSVRYRLYIWLESLGSKKVLEIIRHIISENLSFADNNTVQQNF